MPCRGLPPRRGEDHVLVAFPPERLDEDAAKLAGVRRPAGLLDEVFQPVTHELTVFRRAGADRRHCLRHGFAAQARPSNDSRGGLAHPPVAGSDAEGMRSRW